VPDMKTRPSLCMRRADTLLSGATHLVLRLVLVFLIGPMTECGRLQWLERLLFLAGFGS
jgi:hypothetical protein